MSIPSRRGPKPLSEILGELFTARGYGQFRARAELEAAWASAVGATATAQTELGEVRRGVLNVTVAHSALLEELSAFRKPAILVALRAEAPGTTIHDIRFRVGPLGAKSQTSSARPAPRSTKEAMPDPVPPTSPAGRIPTKKVGGPSKRSRSGEKQGSHGEANGDNGNKSEPWQS
jgi:hypothetical protein